MDILWDVVFPSKPRMFPFPIHQIHPRREQFSKPLIFLRVYAYPSAYFQKVYLLRRSCVSITTDDLCMESLSLICFLSLPLSIVPFFILINFRGRLRHWVRVYRIQILSDTVSHADALNLIVQTNLSPRRRRIRRRKPVHVIAQNFKSVY